MALAKSPFSVLINRDFVFLLAVGLGLAHGGPARLLEALVFPALTMVMTLATMTMSRHLFGDLRRLSGAALAGVALNYLLLTGALLGLNELWVADASFYNGFVIVAAVPPAVAIIPFAGLLRGDGDLALLGTVAGYAAGLAIMPMVMAHYFGVGFVDSGKLLVIVLELIALPIAFSRLLLKTRWSPALLRVRGPLTNWCFFIIVYTIVGLNRDLFLEHARELWPVAVVAAASTFALGGVLYLAARRLGRPRAVSAMLLGTLKNYGMAAGIALELFGQRTAVPATVTTFFFIMFMIWQGVLERREARTAQDAG